MTFYSVTNISPNIQFKGYNNPVFRNTPPNLNSKSLLSELQTDTVCISEKKENQGKKENSSKANNWGIVALSLLSFGALVCALTKDKNCVTQVKKTLSEFRPAKTTDEAKSFAQKTLNVNYLDENKANLDMINTVNEWLYKEKFIAEKNIPEFVHFTEKNIENPLHLTDKIIKDGKGYNALGVNVNYINKFEDLITLAFNPKSEIKLNQLIKKNSDNVYEIVKPEYKCENLEKLVNKLNTYNKNSSFKDKMEIYDGIGEAISYLRNIQAGKNVKMSNFSSDGAFLHEMGHLLHQDSYKMYSSAKEGAKICQEFINNEGKIAQKVSDYATNSPLEFVAETYKHLRRGETFSDDIINLYKKYNGPPI